MAWANTPLPDRLRDALLDSDRVAVIDKLLGEAFGHTRFRLDLAQQ
jgi:hypothetical protein